MCTHPPAGLPPRMEHDPAGMPDPDDAVELDHTNTHIVLGALRAKYDRLVKILLTVQKVFDGVATVLERIGVSQL
jgi:hypothetical protein